MVKHLTPEGFKKIKEELEYLKKVKRKEVADRIHYAASFGDISENAAYDEAKEAQAFLEGKIQELESIVSQAKVITKNDNGKIQIGSVVHLRSGKNKKEKFQIVEPEEADIIKGKMSRESPLGKELLGKEEGQKAKVKTPNGNTEYKILKIE